MRNGIIVKSVAILRLIVDKLMTPKKSSSTQVPANITDALQSRMKNFIYLIFERLMYYCEIRTIIDYLRTGR